MKYLHPVKNSSMEHEERLDALHKEVIEKLEAYLQEKGYPRTEDHEGLHEAKNNWQNSWAKLRETLMVLERIEI